MIFRYPAFVETDGDEIVVRFHDFPEIFCTGTDEEEALFNATEALTRVLVGHIDLGWDVPYPTSDIHGAHYIAPIAIVQSSLNRCFGQDPSSRACVPEPTGICK